MFSCKSPGVVAPHAGNRGNGPAADYLQALLQFEPWAESVWKDYPKIPNSGYFGDGKSWGNGGIRGTCNIALSYAVLIRAFPNAHENQRRLERLEAALRYATATHQSGPDSMVAVDGKKWGVFPGMDKYDSHDWQSPMWATSMGFAAALMEKKLDPELIKSCKRVVAAEADILAGIPPQDGYKFDTKSEENAWDTGLPTLAAAWMPEDSRAEKWAETAKLYMANTYTVPSDTCSPLKEWIKTQTLYPSYALENHGFYHPHYQKNGGQDLGNSYLIAKMVNPDFAEELQPFAEHNVMKVWQFFKGLLLGSGEIAYPSGQDWSLHQYEHICCLASIATHYGDPVAQWAQSKLAKQILYRQLINGNGRFVGETSRITPGGDGFYVEAVQAFLISMAYLHNEMAGFPDGKGTAPENYISHYSDVGLIVQRSANFLTTISYGLKTMAMVYPLNGTTASQQFLISPNTSSFIGTDGKTKLKGLNKTATGFRAELILNGMKGRRSRVIINSSLEAVVFIEIPLDTLGGSQKEWFLAAIENHPLTGEGRTVLWEGGSKMVKERSGEIIQPIPTGWVNIDNWIGLVALPEGDLIYRAAADYNRRAAAEDALVFQPEEEGKPRAVIVLPGKNADVTAAVQKSVKWVTSGKDCKLSFNIPGGKKRIIQVSL